jgi:uncharacterized protein
MLEIRPVCENCTKPLPNDSNDAMICTYECTFCKDCVKEVLHNVCPNCGGGFEKRPSRTSIKLVKDPSSVKVHHKPIDNESFKLKLDMYRNVEANKR